MRNSWRHGHGILKNSPNDLSPAYLLEPQAARREWPRIKILFEAVLGNKGKIQPSAVAKLRQVQHRSTYRQKPKGRARISHG